MSWEIQLLNLRWYSAKCNKVEGQHCGECIVTVLQIKLLSKGEIIKLVLIVNHHLLKHSIKRYIALDINVYVLYVQYHENGNEHHS